MLISLGRSKLAKKKILREAFTAARIDFVDRVCKQFLLSSTDQAEQVDLAKQMQLISLRVINNFGLDFKQFYENEKVIAKIVALVKDGSNTVV